MRSDSIEDLLGSLALLASLADRQPPQPKPHTLAELGPWAYAAQLMIQAGVGKLHELLPPHELPSPQLILRARDLLQDQSLFAAQDTLKRHISALTAPLSDLLTDLLDLPSRSWFQIQQIKERWKLVAPGAPTGEMLDIQKIRVRNGLLDLIRAQLPADLDLAFTMDLDLRLLCGRIRQLDRGVHEPVSSKPVFSFQDQRGISSLEGADYPPTPSDDLLHFVTPVSSQDPGRNWPREKLSRVGFVMIMELPIAIISALTHQLARNPRGLFPDKVYKDFQRRVGDGGWDGECFVDIRRRFVLAHEWGHHLHAIAHPEIPGVSEDSWLSEYGRLTSEAWADHAVLELVVPELDERERIHLEFFACRGFFAVEKDLRTLQNGGRNLSTALFYPALLSDDPAATHYGYLDRIRELCQNANKADRKPELLPLVDSIMDSLGTRR